MSKFLAGKTAIVTGGAGGLGLAIVQRFLSEGANVVATDIDPKRLEECPATVPAEHRERLLAVQCDSTDESAVEKTIEETVQKLGRLDILINCAAINDQMAPVGDCPRALWDRNLLVNLTAPFITSQHSVRQMLKQEPKGGVLLNIISSAGEFGYRAGCAYTASKHGLVGLTKNTAAFYGPEGIRCLAIMPGPMKTNMGSDAHDVSKYHPEGLRLASSSMAAGLRWNPIEEVAKTVALLCTDGVGTINGSLVNCDNGWTCI
ncbi:dehydrogenase [Eremomyces bilateralis CBS 781.70]|uniref:Dehydrogenase n=1 Tax=Eremomyces bilateralis CBS 781.70 TaxID=1392243 RepID=A0A6G1FX06_9PEZI|nr:dehydrogenase [Eremomyces bilateralis CBS 781.70]KAF1810323.1 dehydrogenase [Eremomyces bilateralis CBS 781.70]